MKRLMSLRPNCDCKSIRTSEPVVADNVGFVDDPWPWNYCDRRASSSNSPVSRPDSKPTRGLHCGLAWAARHWHLPAYSRSLCWSALLSASMLPSSHFGVPHLLLASWSCWRPGGSWCSMDCRTWPLQLQLRMHRTCRAPTLSNKQNGNKHQVS